MMGDRKVLVRVTAGCQAEVEYVEKSHHIQDTITLHTKNFVGSHFLRLEP